MTNASDLLGRLARGIALFVAAFLLVVGDSLHAWLGSLGILLGALAWDVASIARHAREHTALLTALAERE